MGLGEEIILKLDLFIINSNISSTSFRAGRLSKMSNFIWLARPSASLAPARRPPQPSPRLRRAGHPPRLSLSRWMARLFFARAIFSPFGRVRKEFIVFLAPPAHARKTFQLPKIGVRLQTKKINYLSYLYSLANVFLRLFATLCFLIIHYSFY